MADLYRLLDVTVATFVDLRSSEKNHFDFLKNLIGSLFSQHKFSPSVPHQPATINAQTRY